jgi:hypothetical protein
MVCAKRSALNRSSCGRVTTQSPDRPASTPAWHDRFLSLLPAIRQHAQVCFRGLPRQGRDDAVDEVVANALVAYARLVELDREEVAYASPLARYAVAQVRSGRRVGSRLNAADVTSDYCQRRRGVVVERLDRFDWRAGQWTEMLVEDRRSSPADMAAFKLDFHDWLARLSERDRRIAEELAMGETTNGVARKFGISAGRVSQLRRGFHETWQIWQGQAVSCAS